MFSVTPDISHLREVAQSLGQGKGYDPTLVPHFLTANDLQFATWESVTEIGLALFSIPLKKFRSNDPNFFFAHFRKLILLIIFFPETVWASCSISVWRLWYHHICVFNAATNTLFYTINNLGFFLLFVKIFVRSLLSSVFFHELLVLYYCHFLWLSLESPSTIFWMMIFIHMT